MIQYKILLRLVVTGLVVFMFDLALADSQYVVKEKKIIEVGVPVDSWSTVEIYPTNGNDVYIALNAMRQEELFLFSKSSEGWDSRSETVPFFTQAGIFSEQEKPQLFTIANEPTSDRKRIQTIISIFEIDSARVNLEKPTITITIPSDKIFSSEIDRKGQRLFPLPDKGENYLLLGNCTQSKWDPIAIVGNIISGGHGGYANWPFLAEIKGDSEVIYHKWPVNYGTNAVAKVSQAVLINNKYHLVGTWHREYMPSHERIEYSIFDLESGKWSKPEKIYEEKGSYSSPCGDPVIQANDENIVIAWSLGNDDRFGPGIFVCSQTKREWSNPEKLTSVCSDPLLTTDSNKQLCVLWREKGKGILLSCLKEGKWSVPSLLLKDEKINVGAAWDVKSDRQGNIHMVYCRKTSERIGDLDKNIVYVRFEDENGSRK